MMKIIMYIITYIVPICQVKLHRKINLIKTIDKKPALRYYESIEIFKSYLHLFLDTTNF